MAEKKQLVLVVEATVNLGSQWCTILKDYLEKNIRKFCGNEPMDQLVQLLNWLLFNSMLMDLTLLFWYNGAAGLEMLSVSWSGYHVCTSVVVVFVMLQLLKDLLKCVLLRMGPKLSQLRLFNDIVAASNPCPLPTVYWPPNMQSVSGLSDAETIGKLFSQSCVSLSVICPKQLPKLKAIYNAGKRNPSPTTPTVDVVKNPNYHILISEDFMEACVALRPSVSRGNIPLATVKVIRHWEPSIVFPMVSSQAVKTYSPTSRESISSNDNLQDMKPVFSNIQRPLCPAGPVNVSILNSLSQARPEAERPKYVKIWEGKLDGKRHGQAVMITRLEAYRRRSSSAEPLSEDWPSVFLIDRLISLDYMNNIHYTRKCELFVF